MREIKRSQGSKYASPRVTPLLTSTVGSNNLSRGNRPGVLAATSSKVNDGPRDTSQGREKQLRHEIDSGQVGDKASFPPNKLEENDLEAGSKGLESGLHTHTPQWVPIIVNSVSLMKFWQSRTQSI